MDQIKSKYKSVHELNWAWQYLVNETWCQFDCPDCLELEFMYQAYTISKKSAYQCANLMIGTVDFEKFGMQTDLSKSVVKVRRTPDNVRKRPNGQKRHDPFKD